MVDDSWDTWDWTDPTLLVKTVDSLQLEVRQVKVGVWYWSARDAHTKEILRESLVVHESSYVARRDATKAVFVAAYQRWSKEAADGAD